MPGYLQQAAVRPGDDLRLDVNKDLLFFYSPDDALAQEWLQANFPDGTWETMPTYQPGDTFNIYRVPAPGEAGFAQFLTRTACSRLAGDGTKPLTPDPSPT